MTSMVSPDRAVSDYLRWLQDPAQLRDQEKIAQLKLQKQTASDVLDELRIHSELKKLEDLPEELFLKPFIEHAKEYAEKHNIPPSAFLEMGVKKQTLEKANLRPPRRSKPRLAGKRRTVEEVADTILGHDWNEFTNKEAIQITKGAPATVRKAIEQLVADGKVLKTDRDDPNHTGRGAKAKLYEIVRTNV